MEIEKRLEKQGIIVNNNFVIEDEPPTSEEDALDQNYLIKFMVTGAFYPTYFSTIPIDRNQVTRDLNGRNERYKITSNF